MDRATIKQDSQEAQKQLLAKLLRQKAGNKKKTCPMSVGQTSIFLAHLAKPEGFEYNILFSFKITSAINVKILEQAFQLVVDRHEILRTTYGFEKNVAIQTIYSHMEAVVDRKDISSLDEAQVKEKLKSDSRRSFDLFQGPVIKACLYTAGEKESYFLLILHHIAGDARSVFVLVKELLENYQRLSQGESITSFEMPKSQYSDFVQWERELLQGERGKILKRYWEKELEGILPILNLPVLSRKRKPGNKSSNSVSVSLDDHLIKRVRELAKKLEVSFYTILLSAFNILLHHYAEEDEILVGTPTSTLLSLPYNEVHPDVIGYTINPVVIRSFLKKGYLPYLKKLGETVSQALNYQAYPFYKIQEEKSRNNNSESSGLFRAMFNYLTFPNGEDLHALVVPLKKDTTVKTGNLELSPFPLPQQEGIFDLGMAIICAGNTVSASLVFDENLFSRESISQKLEDYQQLLDAITRHPGSKIKDLLQTSNVFGSPVLLENNREFEEYYLQSNMTKNMLLAWIGQKLLPDKPLYNNPQLFTIKEEVQESKFLRAFDRIVELSPALRSVFVEKNGIPVRTVIDDPAPSQFMDLSHLSEESFEEWVVEMANKTLDLEKSNYESILIKRGKAEYSWFLNLHQLTVDGFSGNRLIFPLMSEFYRKAVANLPLETSRDLDFEKYLAWEKENRQTEHYKRSKRFWENKLKTKPDPIRFYDTYPDYQSTKIRRRLFFLGEKRTADLIRMAETEGFFTKNLNVSVLNIFVSLIMVLIHKISGNKKLSLGINLHRRQDERFKQIIGLIMHELPLVIDLAEDESFTSLHEKIVKEGAAMVKHSDYAVANPHEEPNYDILVNFITSNQIDLVNTQTTGGWFHAGHAAESLGFVIVSDLSVKDLEVGFDFKETVFSPDKQEMLMRHFLNLFDQFLDDPTQLIDATNLISEKEQKQIIKGFNQTKQSFPQDVTPIDLFEEQAVKKPDFKALVYENHTLTYGELNRNAEQVGNHLAALGLGPGDPIGLCLERSAELITAILGIMKAGACYVPVNPSNPEYRNRLIVEDTNLSLLIYQNEDDLPKTENKIRSTTLATILAEKQIPPIQKQKAKPNHPAYITYTSGSTGTPKGVVVENQNLINAYFAWERAYDLKQIHSHLQIADFSFDVFSGDLVRALCSGGTLVICPKFTLLEPEKLFPLMHKEKVECAEFVPAVLRLLTNYVKENEHTLDFLKILCCASDTWYGEDVQNFFSICGPQTRLINSFGITETTIDSTWYEPAKNELKANEPVPIGKPFANTTLYILDSKMRPVPVGMPGELYIGGAGITRGYLNNPTLTEQQFIQNPFSNQPKDRLYKTGDLAKYQADGTIDYLGRKDDQIKIRGFRIEPGEIESHLENHPSIKEVAIIPIKKGHDKRIIGFIVYNNEPEDLSDYLKNRLPHYMVPQALVELKELPRLPSGKVDKKALENRKQAEPKIDHKPPEDELEAILQSIFCKELELSTISMEDNFFERGGHSLLVIQVLKRIRKELKADLSIIDFFSEPTITGLAKKIRDTLKTNSLLLPKIEPAKNRKTAALTLSQQRIWAFKTVNTVPGAFNVAGALNISSGELDRSLLEKCANEIIARHDILRTLVFLKDDTPFQKVQDKLVIHIPEVETENDEEIELRLVEMSRQEFDFGKGPLVNIVLLKRRNKDNKTRRQVLFLNIHHLVADGWSIKIFFQELCRLYGAFNDNNPSPLPELQRQYIDYAAWQEDCLNNGHFEGQLAYWKQKLNDPPPIIELPCDQSRQEVQTYAGDILEFEVDRSLSEQIIQLSSKAKISLFTALYAGFVVLLSKISNETDILMASVVANRNHPDTDGIFGMFANQIILRSKIESNPTFLEFLTEAKNTLDQALANQDVPFEKVIEKLQPKRNQIVSPVFRVLIAFQTQLMEAFKIDDLDVSYQDIPYNFSRTDLSLFLKHEDRKISGAVEYNTDLFFPETIKRILEEYQSLLSQATKNPEQKISQLSLLSENQKEKILFKWSNIGSAHANPPCVHELFEQIVEISPDSVALVFGNDELTYGQLNAASNQMAHYLISQGMEPGSYVAILMDRSFEMIIAIMAVLKAGGAYVMIDLSFPWERISFMFKDTGSKIALVNKNLPELSLDKKTKLLNVNQDKKIWQRMSHMTPGLNIPNNAPAYISYTSGSTGVPKGAVIPHRAIPGYFIDVDYLTFDRTSVFLQHSSVSWDALTLELFTPLLTGGKCVLFPEKEFSIDGLGQAIKDNGVNTLWLTATLFNAVIDERPGALSGVEQLMTGGEALSLGQVKKALHLFPDIKLVNGYGPSECVVFTTCCRLDCDLETEGPVSIGKPVGDRVVYILDSLLSPVPAGVPGELYVAGNSLAKEYLNQPEVTAKTFINNPFDDNPESRLYKTGDLATFLENGSIRYLGRKDNQVKIRGFRVEPGEIESLLEKHPEVNKIAVVAKEGDNGEKQLVSFFSGTVSGSEMKTYLKGKVPAYMIPQFFIKLKTFPLTNTGKIDRKLLATDKSLQTPDPKKDSLPLNDTQKQLAGMWFEILELEKPPGIHDDFFDLGGQSLKAIRLAARINRDFCIEMSIKDLFLHTTIYQQAEIISGQGLFEEAVSPVVIPKIAQKELYTVSHAQRRMWVLDKINKGHLAYNVPGCFHFSGTLDNDMFKQSIRMLVERHESLRTVFVVKGDTPFQKILETPEFGFDFVDFSNRPDPEKEALEQVQESAAKSFNLETGPLFRIVVIKTGSLAHLVLFNMHHIISDGWSIDVLVNELCAFYKAGMENRSTGLEPLPIQYKDYAQWQDDNVEAGELNDAARFFHEMFKGEIPFLELPLDYPRPMIRTFKGKTRFFEFSESLSSRTSEFCRQNGVSLFMFFSSLVKLLLHKYTGQNDIITGSPVAGRNSSALDHQIGLYVNTIAVRSLIDSKTSFSRFLSQEKETLLTALQHQSYPFDKLIDEIGVQRNPNRSPLFDVMIVFQNNHPFEFSLQDLEVSPCLLENRTAKFDLLFSFEEKNKKINASIEYCTDLFTDHRIKMLQAHLSTICEIVLKSPDMPLSGIEMITDAEKEKILVQHNSTQQDYLRNQTLTGLFESYAKRFPANTAVMFGSKEFTYEQINQQANAIAHYLITEFNIQPDDRIGLMLKRSELMISGIFGILKSGAAYVPLDPEYPDSRNEFILTDSECRLVLTDKNVAHEPTNRLRIVNIRNILKNANNGDHKNPTPGTDGNSLAYVIYTSGSTGNPKGVMIEHHSVINRLNWMQKTYPLSESDRIVQKTPFTFDVSVWEIFWWSLAGASAFMLDPGDEKDPAKIVAAVSEKQISVIHFVPSMFSLFLDHVEEKQSIDQLLSLKHVFTSGEALSCNQVDQFNRLFKSSEQELHNLYGPTEATVDVTSFECTGYTGDRIPIGKPIDNTFIYILDQNGHLMPPGVDGEICIGGANVARGYINNEELTAERFVKNRFHKTGRIYRTGDSGRMLEDGNVLYSGRYDFQVKIRGNRVEPGEIETNLLSHENVQAAAVITRGEGEQCSLIAYVKLSDTFEVESLKTFLRARLPEYMVPSFIIPIEDFPLNASGKIDYKALSVIEPSAPNNRDQPENEVEAAVLLTWEKYLTQDRIGTRDNFFDLGGNSLLLVRVHGELEKQYPGKLTVADLFIHTTIKEIATALSEPSQDLHNILEPIVLPEEFFCMDEEQKELEFQINSQLTDGISRLSEDAGISKQQILLASFAYLLHEISEQERVDFVTVFNGNEMSYSSFDFKQIDSPDALLTRAADIFRKLKHRKSFQDLTHIRINPASCDILTILSFNEVTSIDLHRADIYFAPILKNDYIDCTFRASSRIRNSHARDMVNTLLQILNSISESPITNE